MPDQVSKQQLYGRYQKQEDIENEHANKERDWRSNLAKKMYHKSLDVPIGPEIEDDPLNVKNSRTTTVNGMDWKAIAVLVAGIVGGSYVYTNAPQNQPMTQPAPVIVPQAVSPTPPPNVNPPQDLQFGAEIEIRDAVTGEPIHVEWKKSFSDPKK